MGDIWNLFLKGGYVMYPILLCSIISVTIAVERCLFYRTASCPTNFISNLKNFANENNYADALTLAKNSQGDCARLAENFLAEKKLDLANLETNANLALDSYERHIIFLDMIVTVSPLLGLLGTILGMISAFKVFDLKAGQPFAVTGGIGEALIATAFGLMVAILALALHCLLRYFSDKLTDDIKNCCAILENWQNGEKA